MTVTLAPRYSCSGLMLPIFTLIRKYSHLTHIYLCKFLTTLTFSIYIYKGQSASCEIQYLVNTAFFFSYLISNCVFVYKYFIVLTIEPWSCSLASIVHSNPLLESSLSICTKSSMTYLHYCLHTFGASVSSFGPYQSERSIRSFII